MRGLSKVIGALALLAVLASCQPLSGLGANGLDVSGWQHPNGATIDWAPVRASGRSFAFVKATEGLSYTNPYFGVDWAGLQANGMLRGAYHYGRPELDPAIAKDSAVQRAIRGFTETATSSTSSLPQGPWSGLTERRARASGLASAGE